MFHFQKQGDRLSGAHFANNRLQSSSHLTTPPNLDVFSYLVETRINTSIGFFTGTLFSHTQLVSLFHIFVVPQTAGTNFWRFRATFLHRSKKATGIFAKENRSFTNGSCHGFII